MRVLFCNKFCYVALETWHSLSGLKWSQTLGNPPASGSQVLGLWLCALTSALTFRGQALN